MLFYFSIFPYKKSFEITTKEAFSNVIKLVLPHIYTAFGNYNTEDAWIISRYCSQVLVDFGLQGTGKSLSKQQISLCCELNSFSCH